MSIKKKLLHFNILALGYTLLVLHELIPVFALTELASTSGNVALRTPVVERV